MEVQRAAVIDIGSNSCRLVIYDVLNGAMLQSFNEKTLAGLGRGLSETRVLSPEGRVMALDVCRRYAAILDGLGVTDIYPVATAAVRVAEDGPTFRAEVEAALGRPLRVLSGPDEGHLSALGVVSGFGEVSGLVADLGGSSMELQVLEAGAVIGQGETHLLGPLARASDADLPLDRRSKVIRHVLRTSGICNDKPTALYAVGGGWRNVAAVHMELSEYPLRVQHGYRLTQSGVREVIDAADYARIDKTTRTRLQRVAKRRYDTLLHTALVLEALMRVTKIREVTISAFGLREGVMTEARVLQAEVGTPLRDSVELFARPSMAAMAYGEELLRFTAPLVKALNLSERATGLACYLADTGTRMHPDHRPKLVYEQVLRAPYPLLDHHERLFVAHACASRYTFNHRIPANLKALQDDRGQKQARLFGTALRLAGVFSGRSASILSRASLEFSNKTLKLKVHEADRDMVSETVKRRLNQLSGLLDRRAEIAFI
jgi:exopolyphosphatase/guanosine-5'-triphosphate,3'-diphosphate pyrophosphatase